MPDSLTLQRAVMNMPYDPAQDWHMKGTDPRSLSKASAMLQMVFMTLLMPPGRSCRASQLPRLRLYRQCTHSEQKLQQNLLGCHWSRASGCNSRCSSTTHAKDPTTPRAAIPLATPMHSVNEMRALAQSCLDTKFDSCDWELCGLGQMYACLTL